ncbi:hypothetical protein Pint_13799 [Pistacia integerrima]|uniref:Uncharacterized protein n=1 Tax=Pistacia integerrima TaxID=434235 RepID=A0ACC0Y7I8_9ROSI|nr:hypothetical protein Pint_13799 [Pistacia integerrima]
MESLSCTTSYLLLPAFLLLLLFLTFSRPFNGNHIDHFLTSITSFSINRDSNDTTSPQNSSPIFSPTIIYKSSKHKASKIKNKSRVKRIEADLARARDAIRRAVQLQNYTSEKEEKFPPKRSVYKNAYAFHQLSFSP